MNVILGVIVLIAAIVLMAKKVNGMLVLLGAGLLMALIGLDLPAGLQGFSDGLASTSMLKAVCASAAFAYVTKVTGCQEHLSQGVLKVLQSKSARFAAMPLTMAFAGVVSFALNSGSGTVAALGSVMIPILIAAGYEPAVVAGGLHIATFASVLNPGQSSNAFVAETTGIDVFDIIANQFVPVIVCEAIYIIVTMIVIKALKLDQCKVINDKTDESQKKDFKINPLYCLTEFVPIILLLIGTKVEFLSFLKVEQAMLLGSILAVVITKTNPKDAIVKFWEGAANAFKETYSVIVCAKVFIAGLTVLGVIEAMVNVCSSIPAVAKVAAIAGPALMCIITGSGATSSITFSGIFTPNAEAFGISMLTMGSAITIAGTISNALSPVAGQIFMLSSISGAPVRDIIKRELPGYLVNIIALYIMFFVIGI